MTESATEDGGTSLRETVPLGPIAPLVVLPGQRVTMIVPVANYKRVPKQAKLRYETTCATRNGDPVFVQWRTKKFKAWIPGTVENPPSNPSPERFVARTVKIPERCFHDRADSTRYDGWYTVHQFTEVQGERSAFFIIGKKFIRRNAPYNLSLKSGRRDSDRYQAHHEMPVKFEHKFKKRSINIHNPEYLRWWCSKPGVPTNHQRNAHEYNERWEKFFRKHPKASKRKVHKFRERIVNAYKYKCPRGSRLVFAR